MEQPQAFTCPYCGRMGYTEMSLQEHVAAEHTETSTEVVGRRGSCTQYTHKVDLLTPKEGMFFESALRSCIPVTVAGSDVNHHCKWWTVAVQLYL